MAATVFGATIAILDHEEEEMQHPEHEGLVPVGLRASLAASCSEGFGAYGSSNMNSPKQGIGSVEINVAALDGPKLAVAKEGFLHKLGGNVKNWKTRYFRLTPGRLSYCKDGEPNSSRLGSILLPQATLAVFAGDVYPGHPYCFGITPADDSRQYVLDCDSAAHRSQWMAALTEPVRQRIRAVADSVREGWLVKQGAQVRNWKRRYFVLTSLTLKYYEHFTDIHGGSALGTIPLGGGFAVAADDDELALKAMGGAAAAAAASAQPPASSASGSAQGDTPYGFVLRAMGSDRVFHCLSAARSDRDGWVRELNELQQNRRI